MAEQDVEIWYSIPGFSHWYCASSHGRVRSWRVRAVRHRRAETPRIITGRASGRGYRRVKLTHPVLGKLEVFVHHCVLAAFGQHRPVGMVGDHIDRDPSNNRPENLHWVTPAENVRLAAERGAMTGRAGAAAQAVLTPEDIPKIRAIRADTGRTYRSIGAEFGVSGSTIYRVIKGIGWKHV